MKAPKGTAAAYRACDRALDTAEASGKRWSLWVPGRIEVLGKHTDYAGGRSVLCALDRGFVARASPRKDAALRVIHVADAESVEIQLTPGARGVAGHWSNYVAAVAGRASRDFPRLRGVDIAFVSNLPRAAGMSSSSALLVMIFMALSRANRLSARPAYRRAIRSREQLAAYLGAMENGRPFAKWPGDAGVGTMGGNEDHVAIVCSETGQLQRYLWSPVTREDTITMPAGHVFALASSGVEASKTGAAMERYNHASRATRVLTDRWNQHTKRRDACLFDALISRPDAARALRELASKPDGTFTAQFLTARLDQFVAESLALIPAACDALRRGALSEFGLLVDRSHALAELNLGNQTPETIALQRLARGHGAVAASAFGAGFGGSVWAMVPARGAQRFLAKWRESYLAAFPGYADSSEFFVSAPGGGAAEF